MGFQYKHTLLHEKTSKLLDHVQKIMNKSEIGLEYGIELSGIKVYCTVNYVNSHGIQ